jgi:hypothetical protein
MVLRYLIAQHYLRLLGAWQRSFTATDGASEAGVSPMTLKGTEEVRQGKLKVILEVLVEACTKLQKLHSDLSRCAATLNIQVGVEELSTRRQRGRGQRKVRGGEDGQPAKELNARQPHSVTTVTRRASPE